MILGTPHNVSYRSDIDGLRAIAVLAVLAFHSGLAQFSGGFVGVDVFFVISGYLITTLIYQDLQLQRFSFRNFYKRRVARLLPAFALTLFAVTLVGFFLYDTQTYDKLGKELFFSALGVVNFYFAQGTDYFASAETQQPLIHLWSLGVEEQFYLVWPVLLILAYKLARTWLFTLTLVLFLVALGWSEWAAQTDTKGAYFLPHYRAFELLLGALCAFVLTQNKLKLHLPVSVQHGVGAIAAACIVLPIMLLDENSRFPGLNALWPCLGAALLILLPAQSWVNRLLAAKALVVIGLISYPLYLYHQPVITFLALLVPQLQGIGLFSVTLLIAGPLAWLTYRYVEQPTRQQLRHAAPKRVRWALANWLTALPVFAVLGVGLGRSDGLPQRFDYLNPFATEVIEAHQPTFYSNFQKGVQLSSQAQGGMLIVGDSLAQQYAEPLRQALGYTFEQVDTATRGACVFLKGVDFTDQVADVPCDTLRHTLYASEKRYDYVVLSQAWHFYQNSVHNFQTPSGYEQWEALLKETLAHFSAYTDTIIVIGAHPRVANTARVQASLLSDTVRYRAGLQKLSVSNLSSALARAQYFDETFAHMANVMVVNPIELFCQNSVCQLHDGTWSFFSDEMHLTQRSTNYVVERLREQLALKQGQTH